MTAPVPRTGGRLLLVDPAERLLLIHERLEGGGSHWLTPGGGVERGETPARAAVRESAEEIGFDAPLDPAAEPVLVTRRHWGWAGVTYDQVDHFFLLRVAAPFEPRPRGLTEMERATLMGHAWWSLGRLRASDERFVPSDIAEVLAGLIGQRAVGG